MNNNTLVPTVPCQLCCQILTTSVSKDFNVGIFHIVVILFAIFTVAYLLLKLRMNQDQLAIHYNVIIWTCIVFMFVIVIKLIDGVIHAPGAKPGKVLSQAISMLDSTINAFDWFIQIVIVLFATKKDTTKKCTRKAILESLVIASIFLLITFTTEFACESCNPIVISEALLVLLFSYFWLNQKRKLFKYLTPRDSCSAWIKYNIANHALYWIWALVSTITNDQEASSCLLVASFSFYYILFAYMLNDVTKKDSAYWKAKGGIIRALETQKDLGTPEQIINNGDKLTRIPWEELEFSKLVGVGAFGDVWRGLWRDTDVAIKKLKILNTKESAILKLETSLINECQILCALRHPNIVMFLGLCMDAEDCRCIVTEYLEGNLFDLLHPDIMNLISDDISSIEMKEDQPLINSQKPKFSARKRAGINWKQKYELILDIATGLNFLHTTNPIILHRDLKSQNILVTKNLRAKICDMGQSKVKVQTAVMTTTGTPQWCAPEILKEDSYSESADVYSFGVLIWEIITEQIPWFGMSPLRVMYTVAHEAKHLPIPLTPEPLTEILHECLTRDPKERPTMSEIIAKLKSIDPNSLNGPLYVEYPQFLD